MNLIKTGTTNGSYYSAWAVASSTVVNMKRQIATFDRLLELAQQANHSSHLCMAYRELALAHIFRSDLATAIRYSQLAVKLGSSQDNELLQTQALFCHFVEILR